MTSDHSKTEHRLGFTLLELMALAAIIAILAALAIPSYQGRIIRQQIEAGMSLADIAKKPVAASWAAAQVLPVDNAAAGLPAADRIVNNYISAVSLQDGAINLTFGNRANSAIKGKILTLRPAVVTDAPVVPVEWICSKAEVPARMTVRGINQTNIPDGYLPLICHSVR